MDDSLMDDFSDFHAGDASSDFEPAPKAKAAKNTKSKAPAPKKPAAAPKPRGRPPKDASQAKPKKVAAPKRRDASDAENSDVDMMDALSDHDQSLLDDTPPSKKPKPAANKASGKPLADVANAQFGSDGAADVPKAKAAKAGGTSSKYQMVGPTRARVGADPASSRTWNTS